jgi:pyruvate/2-oxoglutarate dehydrogenase complex dihydrolipoamide dehydrogenase (E3) component
MSGLSTTQPHAVTPAAAATSPHAGWASDPLPDGRVWDLLVVGGGTAGLVAAKTAAGFGVGVLLAERDRTGGDCLWSGCVPSKALLSAAHAASAMRAACRHGIRVGDISVDFLEVMRTVHAAVAAIEPADSPETLRAAGVRVAHATVTLTGDTSADLDGQPVRFRQALLATGSAPVLLPIPGLAEADPLTSDTLWSLTALPQRLLVLGGGSIGCELGQAFARLGAQVTLVEAAPRLLNREDADVAGVLTDALLADGVSLRVGIGVTAVRRDGPAWSAELGDGSRVAFDQVLVAVGRRPSTHGIGLEHAGVELDDHGYVRVDARLRTTNRRIWAAGDLTGHPQFTHTAGMHGSLAASNAVLGLRRTVDTATTPRVTFTQPEVAAVGVGADQAANHPHLTVRTVQHAEVDRAITEGEVAGFSRLVLDRRGRVVGATIVGPRAGESLAEVVLAVRQGLRARELAGTTHAYPTYSDGIWKAAIEQVQRQMGRPAVRAVTAVLTRLRRLRVARWAPGPAHRHGSPTGDADATSRRPHRPRSAP